MWYFVSFLTNSKSWIFLIIIRRHRRETSYAVFTLCFGIDEFPFLWELSGVFSNEIAILKWTVGSCLLLKWFQVGKPGLYLILNGQNFQKEETLELPLHSEKHCFLGMMWQTSTRFAEKFDVLAKDSMVWGSDAACSEIPGILHYSVSCCWHTSERLKRGESMDKCFV